ncbi:MAG: hypothetical protein ACFE0O_14825 [Opitutales bacterium]
MNIDSSINMSGLAITSQDITDNGGSVVGKDVTVAVNCSQVVTATLTRSAVIWDLDSNEWDVLVTEFQTKTLNVSLEL